MTFDLVRTPGWLIILQSGAGGCQQHLCHNQQNISESNSKYQQKDNATANGAAFFSTRTCLLLQTGGIMQKADPAMIRHVGMGQYSHNGAA